MDCDFLDLAQKQPKPTDRNVLARWIAFQLLFAMKSKRILVHFQIGWKALVASKSLSALEHWGGAEAKEGEGGEER